MKWIKKNEINNHEENRFNYDNTKIYIYKNKLNRKNNTSKMEVKKRELFIIDRN